MHSVQDPFQIYRERLAAKEAKRDMSDEALAARAAKKAKRDTDRTTWLGTNLGEKGSKRARDEDVGGVGKYLAGKPSGRDADASAASFGMEGKKQRKLGSFGNFSNW